MNKPFEQPGQEPLNPPVNPTLLQPAIVEQPAVLEDPQAGGSYTRDPVTGALTLVTPSTDNT